MSFLGSIVQAGAALLGGQKQAEGEEKAAKLNAQYQKDFATHGVRWKVDDAKMAGIHPLAALGAQTHSFSPSFVGGGDRGISAAGAAVGQGIDRAIQQTRTQEEQELAKLQLANAKADLDGKVIENQYKASQLKKLLTPTAFPGSDNFMPGQGNSGLVKEKPLERVVSAPGRPAQEAGWRPDVAYSRTDTGLTPVVPESLSESLEDDVIGKLFWRIRNQFIPNVSKDATTPPKSMLPPGYDFWYWSKSGQEFRPGKLEGPMDKANFKPKYRKGGN